MCFSLLTLLLVSLAACEKSAPPVAPPPAPAAKSIAIAPPPATAGEKELTLDEMSYAVQAWFTSRGAAPKSLQEMVKAGFIKRLPTPPPGKEFAIDEKGMRVVLINR